MKSRLLPAYCMAGLVLITYAAAALAQTDEGVARHIPWSGYWYPAAKGEILEPLRKYDALTGRNAYWWEYQKNPPGPSVPEWHGLCHGWAAAAVLEREPNQPRVARRGGGAIPLGVSDQKALLTACHTADAANWYGDRYGDGVGSEDPNDMTPDALWQLLRMFLRDQRVPIVMDLDPGPEVWNYPVYAYRIEYRPHPAAAGWFAGQLSLWAADDAVPPDFVGLVPHFQTYTFSFQMHGRAIVAGSAQWTGQSVHDHPDFAWYPYVVMPENPELHYAHVKQIIGSSPAVAPADAAGPQTADGTTSIPGYHATSTEAARQPIPVSPIQLVSAVANRTSSFELDLRPAQFGQVQYSIGEALQLVASSPKSGYLYLFHLSPVGELSLLFPAPGDDNRITAGADFRLPRQGAAQVPGPLGNHILKAIVSEQPLLITGLNHEPQRDAQTRRWQPRSLRLCPTQTRLVKSLLGEYVQGKSLTERQLPGEGVNRLPGFAQDEFTFYVGPRR